MLFSPKLSFKYLLESSENSPILEVQKLVHQLTSVDLGHHLAKVTQIRKIDLSLSPGGKIYGYLAFMDVFFFYSTSYQDMLAPSSLV